WVPLDSPPETPPGKISVTLRDSIGTLPSPRGQLMLWTVDGGRALQGKIDNDGTVELLNVPPGEYRFTFSEGGRGKSISAILKNGQPLQTRHVNLSSGQELALTISIS